MGSGASTGIDIKDTERSPAEAKLLEVIGDKKLLGKFFKEVALAHSPNKGKGNDFNINNVNVLDFYNYNPKSEFHVVFELMGEKKLDLTVLTEAFKFVKQKKKDYIVAKQWLPFLRSLYHISMLYKAFHAVDNFFCDDKIFLHEFKQLKNSLASIEGMKIEISATDEEIEEEFKKMDKNGDNNITFAELCAYAQTKIHQPELEDEITSEEHELAAQEATDASQAPEEAEACAAPSTEGSAEAVTTAAAASEAAAPEAAAPEAVAPEAAAASD